MGTGWIKARGKLMQSFKKGDLIKCITNNFLLISAGRIYKFHRVNKNGKIMVEGNSVEYPPESFVKLTELEKVLI